MIDYVMRNENAFHTNATYMQISPERCKNFASGGVGVSV